MLNPYKASSLFIIDLKVPLPVVMLTTPKLKSVRLNSCELEVDGEKDIVSSPRNTFMVLLPEPSLR